MTPDKIQAPPPLEKLRDELETSKEWLAIRWPLLEAARQAVGYPHWNDLCRRPAPEGATYE